MIPNITNFTNDPILNPPALVCPVERGKAPKEYPKFYMPFRERVIYSAIKTRDLRTDKFEPLVFSQHRSFDYKIKKLRKERIRSRRFYDSAIMALRLMTNTPHMSDDTYERIIATREYLTDSYFKNVLTENFTEDVLLLDNTSTASTTSSEGSTSSTRSSDSLQPSTFYQDMDFVNEFIDIPANEAAHELIRSIPYRD